MAGIVRRRYLGGAAAALGGLVAAACGEPTVRYVGQPQAGPAGPAGPAGAKGETGAQGQQGAQGAQGAAAKAPVTLDFQHRWNGPAREPLVDQAIEMFEEEYDNILVDLTMNLTPGGPGVDGGVPIGKIIAAIAAGSPPDVFMIHGRATIDLARRNALTWIDDYLTRDKRSLEELYFPAIIPFIQLDGRTYALPQTASGDNPYVFYNEDMLAAKGIDPQELTTWQGLLESAKILTEPDGDSFKQVGFNYPGTAFYVWHTVNAGRLFEGDGKTVAFNDELGIEALTYPTDAVNQAYGEWNKFDAFMKSQQKEGQPGLDPIFYNGKMGILMSGPWQWINAPDAAPNLKMGASRMPRNANNANSKQTTLAQYTWTWAMGAGLKNPDEAWLLERWMSQDDGHRHLMTSMGRGTMYRPVAEDPVYYKANPGWDTVLETINAATPAPASLGLAALIRGINGADMHGKVLRGEASVKSVIDEAARAAQVEVDEAFALAAGS